MAFCHNQRAGNAHAHAAALCSAGEQCLRRVGSVGRADRVQVGKCAITTGRACAPPVPASAAAAIADMVHAPAAGAGAQATGGCVFPPGMPKAIPRWPGRPGWFGAPNTATCRGTALRRLPVSSSSEARSALFGMAGVAGSASRNRPRVDREDWLASRGASVVSRQAPL